MVYTKESIGAGVSICLLNCVLYKTQNKMTILCLIDFWSCRVKKNYLFFFYSAMAIVLHLTEIKQTVLQRYINTLTVTLYNFNKLEHDFLGLLWI